MDLGKLKKLAVERECKQCWKVFKTDPSGYPTALVLFTDHLIEHQPTAEQWTIAYEKIQASRTKGKE